MFMLWLYQARPTSYLFFKLKAVALIMDKQQSCFVPCTDILIQCVLF